MPWFELVAVVLPVALIELVSVCFVETLVVFADLSSAVDVRRAADALDACNFFLACLFFSSAKIIMWYIMTSGTCILGALEW